MYRDLATVPVLCTELPAGSGAHTTRYNDRPRHNRREDGFLLGHWPGGDEIPSEIQNGLTDNCAGLQGRDKVQGKPDRVMMPMVLEDRRVARRVDNHRVRNLLVLSRPRRGA